VIPAAFDYERAASVEQAVELLGRADDAKAIAGGHSLIPLMRLRFARPSLLVDIGRIPGLSYVRAEGAWVAIGALTRHAELEHDPVLAAECALLAQAAERIGDPQIRHRGTIGGSIAHGDPASDLSSCLLALDAELVALGPGGERTIPADEFFTGFFETALGRQDVLTEIRVPKVVSSTYVKFSRRAHDWATVGVAAARLNGGARVALTSMGLTPLRARGVEEALSSGADAATAAQHAGEGTEPPSDPSGSAEYRRHLAQVLVRRALEAL
jgi:carbon-monoxide dehydrogenase medium subunit